MLQSPNALTLSLVDLFAEAQDVLAYRTAVNVGDWTAAEQIVSAQRSTAQLQLSYSEREHVRRLCAYRGFTSRIEQSLAEPLDLAAIVSDTEARIDVITPCLCN